MLSLDDIKRLQAMQSNPSVTVTTHTYRTAPDNQKDPIRVKNLVREAVGRLEDEHGKRETADIVARLHEMEAELDHAHNLDGLVMLASADFQAVYRVPFVLPERVAVDDNFLTRDLVFAMNRTPLYWLLMLAEGGTKLYLGRKESLAEVRRFGFPMDHGGPGGGSALKSGIGANPSRERDRALEGFMRDVDAGLGAAVKEGPYPVVVVGVDRNLSPFKNVGRNQEQVVSYIEGGHDHLSAHDLGALVWPEAREALHERRRTVLDDVEQAVSQNRFVTDLNECWQAAQDGRVELMVVEENLHHPARVTEGGRSLELLSSDEPGDDVYADAVDEMIEFVMQNGGRAVFVDDGDLKEHGGLVMITRY